jgi:hypothetical protein
MRCVACDAAEVLNGRSVRLRATSYSDAVPVVFNERSGRILNRAHYPSDESHSCVCVTSSACAICPRCS